MDTKISTKITQHLEHNWRFWLGFVYFTLLILVSVAVIRKQMPERSQPAPEPVAVVASPAVDLEPLQRRIEQLERDLQRESQARKLLETHQENLDKSNQRLERRLQAHTEAFKRICEYVMVITVDKKIVPRQCLPEYRWSREEGL